MAPEEPHLNAGAAESAHVQATPSPASNDAPPTRSCNPVKKHAPPDSRSFASIRGYFAYFAFFAFFVVPSRHSAKPPQPNFKFPISSFHSHSRPFVVPSPTLRPLRSLREIISRQARQVRQGSSPHTHTPTYHTLPPRASARESPRREGVFPGLRPSLIAEKPPPPCAWMGLRICGGNVE